MNCFKKLALATAVSSVVGIAGCGGSSGGSSSDSNTASGETISGIATAPAGTVAHWQEPGLMEVAVNFLISPAAAALNDLLAPVKGADVELIRVDDNGDQLGDVLASTVTSNTGNYTLPLPEGVSLAGNLVVRITGQNNQQLRAQVVERDVDITPISEFVLRKFIQTGADLDELEVTDIVKLSGKVEEYDLTKDKESVQNLDAMFTLLENEVGAFIENDVVAISAEGAATAIIAGTYVNAAFGFALHDTDKSGFGTYAHDLWINRFTFADGGTGTVNISYTGGESGYANLFGTALETANVYYEVDIDQEMESFEGSYNTSGVLSVEGDFEEEIDLDIGFGWRWPGQRYIFQEVAGQGLFIGLNHEAAVRYELTDTDNDGQEDALDPSARAGDEALRTLEIFIRQPTSLTPADVQGDYGRVYLSALLEDGYLELTTETNLVEFTGTFEATIAAGTSHELMVNSNGAAAYTTTSFPAESTAIPIAADGSIDFGDGIVGQTNESGSFIDVTETDGCNSGSLDCGQSEAGFDKTLLVKLPSTQLDLSGKKYRLMFMAMHLDGGGTNNMVLSATRFNTYMNMTSDSAGTLSGTISELEKPEGLGSDLVSVTSAISEQDFTISVAPNGSTTVTIPSHQAGEETVFEGYFNEDGSLGVFTTGYVEAGGDRDELGLAVLIDVTP